MGDQTPLSEETAPGIPPPPLIASSSISDVARRPASVTVVALLVSVISLYYAAYSGRGLFMMVFFPQAIRTPTNWLVIPCLILLISASALLISAINLFRRREWARRGIVIFSPVLACCIIITMCYLWTRDSSTISFPVGFILIYIFVVFGGLPVILLSRQVVREYFVQKDIV